MYAHFVPLHVVAEAFAPLHTLLQPPQVEVDESDVSHPLMSGAPVWQSAKPVSQPA